MLAYKSLHPLFCGRRWIRTTEGINQQIYSLPHLATLVFALSRLQSYEVFFYFTISEQHFLLYAVCKRASDCCTTSYTQALIGSACHAIHSSYNARSLPSSDVAFKAHIFNAVTALSLPLFPTQPPARSRACCIVSVVITPKITGGLLTVIPPTMA